MTSRTAATGALRSRPSIQGADQSLYGTTTMGGDARAGTLFRIALDGTFTTLHSFDYGSRVACHPTVGLSRHCLARSTAPRLPETPTCQSCIALRLGSRIMRPSQAISRSGRRKTPRSQTRCRPATRITTRSRSRSLSNGAKGTATLTNTATGAFTYTPKPNANGTDSFTFQVNDGKADSNVATVTVTIDPVNDAPVASNGAGLGRRRELDRRRPCQQPTSTARR